MSTANVRPWYRHIWPWALMAPPAASVVFWAIIITTMASPPDLVVEDYDKVGLTYAEDQSTRRAASALGVSANAQIERDNGHVSLRLSLNEEAPDTLNLVLVHATEAARDHRIELRRNSAGIYHGSTDAEIIGARELRLTPVDGRWTISGHLGASQRSVSLAPHARAEHR